MLHNRHLRRFKKTSTQWSCEDSSCDEILQVILKCFSIALLNVYMYIPFKWTVVFQTRNFQFCFKTVNLVFLFLYSVPGDHPHQVLPAAMKLAFRYHIQTMCRTIKCVDSLVIYMNSPTKTDGTSLLWDVNGDGMVNDILFNIRNNIYYLKYTKAPRDYEICDILNSCKGRRSKSRGESEKGASLLIYT